jgi:tRNA-splicing ligase RtcB
MSEIKLRRMDEYRWEVPREGAMRVPGIIYSSSRLMKAMGQDESPKQVANVARHALGLRLPHRRGGRL